MITFINNSKNTIYLADIDKYIPVKEGEPQSLSIDDAKKSLLFRKFISDGTFTLESTETSLFERNLMRIQQAFSNTSPEPEGPQPPKIRPAPTGELEVNMRGSFYEAGGYAKTNRNLAVGLLVNGVKIGLDPLPFMSSGINELESRRIHAMTRPVSRDAIHIDSMIPTFAEPDPDARYNILYTTVESGTIPDSFVESMNRYDEIWTISDFCKGVIKQRVDKPIYVIPNSIDISLYHSEWEPLPVSPKLRSFPFISVFSWSYRKGYDALLRAYLEEFGERDDVSLVLVTRTQVHGAVNQAKKVKQEIRDLVQKYNPRHTPHICLYTGTIAEHKMPALYRACKAFVMFSRGEGFGLPYAEAALCGLPVIATDYSGHTMFLNLRNAEMVDIDGVVKMPEGSTHVDYWDGHEFADLTSEKFIRSARRAMRSVFQRYSQSRLKNMVLKKDVIKRYKIETVSKIAKERLEEIWRGL